MHAHANSNATTGIVSKIRRPECLDLKSREKRHTSKLSAPEISKADSQNLERWTEQQKLFTLSAVLENHFSQEIGNDNGEKSCYLKTMISSLLENQLTLSSALDDTREACAQLNFEKAELAASNSQEVCELQMEISLCRQREAEIQLAHEELQHRVESIDKIIEEIPWLDFIFNSKEPLAERVRFLNSDKLMGKNVKAQDLSTPHLSPLRKVSSFQIPESESNTSILHTKRVCRSGSVSPLSDSGCPSESHDDLSLASLTSAHSSPYIPSHKVLTRGSCDPTSSTNLRMNARSHLSIDPKNMPIFFPPNTQSSETAEPIQMRRSHVYETDSTKRPVSTFGRITDSLKKSITKFADKSEWKMEALRSQQREARTMLMLNETQSEVRNVKARCCGLKRLQDQQEARIQVYVDEIERLKNTERQLRRELRTWQQRVFQVETENQEIKHNSKIVDLENKSRLLEANMRLSQMDQLLQQKSAYADFLPTPKLLLGSEKSSSCLDLKAQIFDRCSLMGIYNGCLAGGSRLPKANRLPDTPERTEAEQMRNLRHRFASTSNLPGPRSFMRSDMIIPENQVSSIARTSSTCQLRMLNSEQGGNRGLPNIRTVSFGSLSELELKADI